MASRRSVVGTGTKATVRSAQGTDRTVRGLLPGTSRAAGPAGVAVLPAARGTQAPVVADTAERGEAASWNAR